MIVEYVRYTLTAHTPEALITAYGKAGRFLTNSSACRGFELAQCTEDTNTFILRIQWTSVEDHLVGFRQNPLFPPFLAEIQTFIPEISEMRHYRSIPV